MKMLANDVHRMLRESAGHQLAKMGFEQVRGSGFAMQKQEGNKYLVLWAQFDRYGWEDPWGSRFTIELQWSESPQVAAADIMDRARFTHLLDEEQLERVRQINNGVIACLPGHVAGQALKVKDADGFETTVVGYAPADKAYSKGFDIWLHYGEPNHIETWAEFIVQCLPGCIAKLKKENAS